MEVSLSNVSRDFFNQVFAWSLKSSFSIILCNFFFTGSNQSPFFNIQGFYRVKPVSRFRFTRLLQVQIPVCFMDSQDVYSVVEIFTGSLQVGIRLVYAICMVFTRLWPW